LTIIDDKGKSHQIDHIEIRQNGIFCIETKNYSGWIFGSEAQQMWTQVLYNEKHTFLNPIKQNRYHIYHLNKLLREKYKIHSIIVMVQNNADRIDIPYVVNLRELKSYVKNYYDGTYYSEKDLDIIYNDFMSISQDISRAQHVSNIESTQDRINNNICPRCGKNLVYRKGKYGDFYGCSGYPECKFTKKIYHN
jgi:hypothetical protein